MNVLVIDGQGGGIGKLLVSGIKSEYPDFFVTAVGANSIATSAMLKAGADVAATGENAVCVGCRKADVIAGPVGIVIADALLGEITPKMAAAIGQSDAKRVLVPVNHCDLYICDGGITQLRAARALFAELGVGDIPMAKLVQSAVKEIGKGS